MNTKVSVYMITYNQEKYIAQAIDGILMQKTSFKYELIIGEDCSIDNTRSICEKYSKVHPDIVRLLPSKCNLGMQKNALRTFKACTGKYIALCEGDDYWTDPNKLQKQVDFLEANPDFSIAIHNVHVESVNQEQSAMVTWPGSKQKDIISIQEILEKGTAGATCSMVFRRDCLIPLPNWFGKFRSGDTLIQIICTTRGKMKYFKEVMGVYRKHSGGSSVLAVDSQEHLDRLYQQGPVKMEFINKLFDMRYDREIKTQLVNYYYFGLIIGHFNNILRHLDESYKYSRLSLEEDTRLKTLGPKRRVHLKCFIVINRVLKFLFNIIKKLGIAAK